jgi:Skp family chaperone for outer membrane proteins
MDLIYRLKLKEQRFYQQPLPFSFLLFPYTIQRMFKVVFSALLLSASLSSAETRIGFINFKQVTDQYKAYKNAVDQLKSEETNLKKELQVKWKTFEALVDEAVTLQRAMNHEKSPSADQFKKMKELENKIESEKKLLRTFKTDKEKQFQKVYATQTEKILKGIHQIAAQIAKEKGYDLIINSSDLTTHATSLVPYLQSKDDITQELIQRLNKTNS